MTKRIIVKVLDGKENTIEENRVEYLTGVPEDILFYEKDGVTYANWWNGDNPPNIISIPVRQIVSID